MWPNLLKYPFNPTIKEIIPGTKNAVCQLNLSIKKPANNVPKPIPNPPNIPFIPRARPVFFDKFTTQEMATG